MEKRSGEKIGWIGGFIWIVALSIIFVIQGKHAESASGFVLVIAALVSVILTAPWKHPNTAYWKLMIPIYLVCFLSIGWAIWSFGGI